MTQFTDLYPARHLDLPGVGLLYRDTGGDGPVIVFVHANTGSSESWEPQFAALHAAGYRLIAFDRRGLGGSVAMPENGPQPGSVSEDMHGLVTHLGLDRFFLIGVAGGAFQVLDYAAWQPDRVSGIIIAASNGRISENEVQEAIARLKVPCIDDDNHHFLELSPTYRLIEPDGTRRWMDIERRAKGAGPAVLQPLRTPNTYAKLRLIACPALVLSGCADMLAPPALMKLWVRYLRNAEFVELTGVGHALTWERPDLFNAKALEFLGRVKLP